MPRRPRHYLPGMPYHIVQRGNNRQPVFFDNTDHRVYLEQWQSIAPGYGDQIHAYCLMTNHIHFLITANSETSLSKTLQVVSSRYARYINKKYKRTGSIWEGRHRSTLVDSSRYFLTCMRYIELNPVRAEMVALPEQYEWSSYRANLSGSHSWTKPHPEYMRLGECTKTRNAAYKELFKQAIRQSDLKLIREATYHSHVLGNQQFIDDIETRFELSLGEATRGRPPSNAAIKS